MIFGRWREQVVAAKPVGSPARPPYYSMKGLLLSLVFAVLLCWPMLLTNGPLIYADTANYYSLGDKIVDLVGNRVDPVPPSEPTSNSRQQNEPSAGGGTEGIKLRSIPYSIYTYLTGATPLGLWLTCLVQATFVLFATTTLIPTLSAQEKRYFVFGLIGIGVLSSLPWFVSYAMPDLLAALVVVTYVAMLRQVDGMTLKGRLALIALATAGVLAHYGNIPLAAGLALAIIAWRWFEKSLTFWMTGLCLAPVVLAAAFNLASGKASTGEESVAPKRLPILLARSLEDGPARWYLNDVCATQPYTICELSDTIPDNVGAFLWGPNGYRLATDAQVEAIRNEETEILFEAFKRYPVTQTRALFGNAVKQTVSVGTGELWPLDPAGTEIEDSWRGGGVRAAQSRVLNIFDTLVPLATFVAIAGLAIAVIKRGTSYPLAVSIGLVVFALTLNAAIFGGLSAPVDRYQSRIVWLLPFLLLLAFVRRGREDDATARIRVG
ncbi:hypothetical protein E3U23_06325 [Erythrobacter litoralis]|uniref:hypothetical protein n=1 Tax=Erythrobacter litoralis TaxID=39960 RepID=UPI0024358770|nr:hypothetical protein [Erythrobacter litoralis]MDG6078807.1 hypothetical protein [Erythrobacter litoralis]